jgi:pimeloyl-ACP methyl ester carboxylesterase
MDIAYQVLGEGPADLLVVPGPFIPFDTIEAEPGLYRFHRRLASFSRVIRFDQRGMGLSSRAALDEIGPEVWAEDAVAVMDAAGCEQATVFGSGFTAMTALVLAAEHPERVRSLIIVNGAPRILWAPDYEPGAELSRADPFRTVAVNPMRSSRALTCSRPSGRASRATKRSASGGTTQATARGHRPWRVR